MIIDLREPGRIFGVGGGRFQLVSADRKNGRAGKFGNGEENLFKSKGYNIFNNLPLAILVNEGSASRFGNYGWSSKEHGVLNSSAPRLSAGVRSELVEITPQTSLKITIAKMAYSQRSFYLRPRGWNRFQSGNNQKDLELENDPQMEKAAEIVNNWKNKR